MPLPHHSYAVNCVHEWLSSNRLNLLHRDRHAVKALGHAFAKNSMPENRGHVPNWGDEVKLREIGSLH